MSKELKSMLYDIEREKDPDKVHNRIVDYINLVGISKQNKVTDEDLIQLESIKFASLDCSICERRKKEEFHIFYLSSLKSDDDIGVAFNSLLTNINISMCKKCNKKCEKIEFFDSYMKLLHKEVNSKVKDLIRFIQNNGEIQ